MVRRLAAGLLAVMAAAVADATPAQRPQVLVSAAASLAGVIETLGRDYEKRTGVRVSVNTGASNTLARQIANGAAVDLFISADEAQMDTVRADIVTGTRVDQIGRAHV